MSCPRDVEVVARGLTRKRLAGAPFARMLAALAPDEAARRTSAALDREWPAAIAEAQEMLAEIAAARGDIYAPTYDADALRVWHKSVDFMHDERFMSAYL